MSAGATPYGGGAEDPGEVGAAGRLGDRGRRIRRLRCTCWCNCVMLASGFQCCCSRRLGLGRLSRRRSGRRLGLGRLSRRRPGRRPGLGRLSRRRPGRRPGRLASVVVVCVGFLGALVVVVAPQPPALSQSRGSSRVAEVASTVALVWRSDSRDLPVLVATLRRHAIRRKRLASPTTSNPSRR
jgi:hypothetical protein